MVMIPTPGWKPKPICFGTTSLEKGLLAPLLVDTICEVLEQMPDFGITQEEKLPELILAEEAQAWLDEFMNHIGGKGKDLLDLATST
ncbi:hypothetical protein ACFXTN_027085 [Malus domestica]